METKKSLFKKILKITFLVLFFVVTIPIIVIGESLDKDKNKHCK